MERWHEAGTGAGELEVEVMPCLSSPVLLPPLFFQARLMALGWLLEAEGRARPLLFQQGIRGMPCRACPTDEERLPPVSARVRAVRCSAACSTAS